VDGASYHLVINVTIGVVASCEATRGIEVSGLRCIIMGGTDPFVEPRSPGLSLFPRPLSESLPA
jgi:hypothetical protein